MTFTAQDVGMYSQKYLKQFWNRVLFTKQSEKTLQLLGNAIRYEFMSKQSFDFFFQNNLYKSLRIGLDDYMLNLTPFFRLNGLAKLSLNSLATHAIFYNSMWN